MSFCRRLIALAVGFVSSAMCQAGDWPQLRGPNGSAATDDAKLPIQWSDSNILWKTPLPGLGVSSAVVSGDALYLTFANPDGTQRTLARYNAKTGKEVWRRTLSFSTHKKHDKNSYATATPATDGERVVVLFADQEKFLVVVYSSRSDELWRNDVGGFSGEHGAGGSPIIEAGKVFFAKEQDGASSLFAFDLTTGKKVWQTDYSVKVATYSTPIVYRGPDGQTCLVCSHSHTGLAGYDLATGKRLWKCDGFELRTVGMPVQAGTIVAATAGQGGSGKMLLAVDLSSAPTGDAELQPAYTLQRGIPYCTTPVAVGDRFYFVMDNGAAGCLDAKSGKTMWSDRLGSPHSASPVYAHGVLFFLSENGEVNVTKPGDKLERVANFKLGDRFLATPAVADGKMYLRGESNLWCIGAK
jgi:outer membrane protein assembly factor BamB